MKKMLSVLLLLACFSPLFSLDDPIFQIHDVPAGPNYTVKDFYVYPYLDTKYLCIAKLEFSGASWRDFVKLNISLFKNGVMVGSDYNYIDFVTYGSSGMWPGSETFLDVSITKAEFDSVFFNVSYSSYNDRAKFNRNALKVLSTSIEPAYGTTYKISGLMQNLTGTGIKFPKVFICFYKSGKMIYFDYDYVDAPDNTLEPLQVSSFDTYVDMPASYDSIAYVPNYSVQSTGDIIISNLADLSRFTAAPKEFSLSQNYPNPFNASTTFSFFIDQPQAVRLEIFDITGKSVMIPFSEAVSIGEKSITINAGDWPSGTYFAVLRGESQVVVRKMMMVR
ncbi:MAG TPA: T9SS type A sorting domain-containing protein [bacterium]|mgnify:CR=1 FL=1|nr:T9SS type A sorting domain-containing protein [bacterium]